MFSRVTFNCISVTVSKTKHLNATCADDLKIRRLICVVSQKSCGFRIESLCGKLNRGLNFENKIMYVHYGCVWLCTFSAHCFVPVCLLLLIFLSFLGRFKTLQFQTLCYYRTQLLAFYHNIYFSGQSAKDDRHFCPFCFTSVVKKNK